MFLIVCLCRSRDIFFRGIHSARPSAEDIIFKAVCVNLRQRKWNFLIRMSQSLTSSLLSRVLLEFRSCPGLLFEFSEKIRGHKAILDSLDSCCLLVIFLVEQRKHDRATSLIKELIQSKGYLSLEILKALMEAARRPPYGFFPSNAVLDALVTSCTEMGATESAYDVIKKMREEKFRIPIHAVNNFLSHLLRIGEAFSVLYNMLKMRIMPNVVAFNMLIDGALRANDFILASKIFCEMGTISMGLVSPNLVTYNCLINGYCKKGSPECAEKILHHLVADAVLKPNIRTYATLLDGYSRVGDLEKAFGIYDEMMKRGMAPNPVVYNSFLHSLYMEGDVSGASIILSDMMENGISPDKFTYAIVLKGLCMNRRVNEAVKLLNWIEEKNAAADAFFYNILIDYLCRNADISGANQLLASMFSRGWIPDQVTYGSMIRSCCKAGEMGSAVRIYTDMVDSNKKPNVVIYNSIMNGLLRRGSRGEGESVLEEMKRENIYDAVSYNTLLNSYCKSGRIEEAFELLGQMGTTEKSVATFNIMIDLLCRFGVFEGVKGVVGMMRFHGLVPDAITYTTVMTGMRRKGCASEEVRKMHDFLILEGV
ncbi:hypothetical protein M569_15456, partial [Genlisea aurea]